jgi:hypothetical protein
MKKARRSRRAFLLLKILTLSLSKGKDQKNLMLRQAEHEACYYRE